MKILAFLGALLLPFSAHAQSVPDWKSYTETGNPADIVLSAGTSNSVAAWVGKKVDTSGGQSTNQNLVTPTISGGSSSGQKITNGDITAASFSCENALACVVSSLIQYSPSWATSVERTLLLRLEDTVSIKDFGSPGDGSVDDTPLIQNAVNALCARTPGEGGTLYFPAGKYNISASVGVSIPCGGLYLRGAGWGWGSGNLPMQGTALIATGTGAANLLAFMAPINATDSYWYGGGVSDMTILVGNNTLPSTKTGAAIYLQHCELCRIHDVQIRQPYIGIEVFSGYQNNLDHVYIAQMNRDATGIYAHGSDSGCTDISNCATRNDVVNITDTRIDTQTAPAAGYKSIGIHLADFMATTWIRHTTIEQSVIGVQIDCVDSQSADACPQFIHADRLEVEVNALNNQGASSAIWADNFVHLECNSCQLYGFNQPYNIVYLDGSRFTGVGHAEFLSGKMEGAYKACLQTSVQDTKVIGGDIIGCGHSGASADEYGVEVQPSTRGDGADEGSTIVSNVNFCTGAEPSASTSMTAVYLGVGVGYNVITGNVFRGCLGGVTDDSGQSSNVNANNTAFP